MRAILTSALLVAAIGLAGCSDGDWRGTAYPDKYDRSQPIDLGTFYSFESCQKAGKEKAAEFAKIGDGSDYECGYKCKFDLDTHANICDETKK